MEITEVRVKLMDDSDDRLQAFCSITFDNAFVVRDLKIIDGTNGPFVAMPSRKLTTHCHDCGSKNHIRANYCNQCGKRQSQERSNREAEGRAKLYADIAHPINSECREMIQTRVIMEFQAELERAKDPSYTSRYDEEYDHEAHESTPGSTDPAPKERLDQEHQQLDGPRNQKDAAEAERESKPKTEPSDPTQNRGTDSGLKGPHTPPKAKAPQNPPKKESGGFGAGVFD